MQKLFIESPQIPNPFTTLTRVVFKIFVKAAIKGFLLFLFWNYVLLSNFTSIPPINFISAFLTMLLFEFSIDSLFDNIRVHNDLLKGILTELIAVRMYSSIIAFPTENKNSPQPTVLNEDIDNGL